MGPTVYCSSLLIINSRILCLKNALMSHLGKFIRGLFMAVAPWNKHNQFSY